MSSSEENVIASAANSKTKVLQNRAAKQFRNESLKVKRRVRAAIVEACGSIDRVLPCHDRKKRYAVRCPMPGCNYASVNIKRHLKKDHLWTLDAVSIFASAVIRKFRHARLELKTGHSRPYPCLECCNYYDRLDTHLKKSHHYSPKTTREKIIEAKQFDKEKHYVPQFLRSAFFGTNNVTEESPTAVSTSTPLLPSSPFSLPLLKFSDPLLNSSFDCPEEDLPVAGSSKKHPTKKCKLVQSNELKTFSRESENSLKHLVSNSSVLTDSKRRTYQLDKDAFNYYYTSADELFRDFEKWLVVANNNTLSQAKSYKNAVVEILTCCDSTLTLHPNVLTNSNVLEDKYFSFHFKNIQRNAKLSELDQTKVMSCHTLSNRLINLCLLFRFSEARNVYFGLSREATQRLRCKVDELQRVLKPFRSLRRKLVISKKGVNIISVRLLTAYGKSAFVRGLEKTIRNHAIRPTRDNAVSIRNHLMLSITVVNSLRKSNIALLNIGDYLAAEKSECGYCVVQERYKTAHKYGAKNILVPNDLKVLVDVYLLRYRHLLVNDSHFMTADSKTVMELSNCYRPLFPSMRANQDEYVTLSGTRVPIYRMGSSGITSSLTSCFRKSRVNIPMKRLTPTCIRGSIATYFANNSKEDREQFATLYMKHSRNTMDSFYVSQWNAAEELRFALGIGQSFGVIDSLIVQKSERPPKKEKEVLGWLQTNADEYGFHEVEDIFEEDAYSDDSDTEECAPTLHCNTMVPVSTALENNVLLDGNNQLALDYLCGSTSTPVLPVLSEQTITDSAHESFPALAERVPLVLTEQAVCIHAEQTLVVPVDTVPTQPVLVEPNILPFPVDPHEQAVAKPVSVAPSEQLLLIAAKGVSSVPLETDPNAPAVVKPDEQVLVKPSLSLLAVPVRPVGAVLAKQLSPCTVVQSVGSLVSQNLVRASRGECILIFPKHFKK